MSPVVTGPEFSDWDDAEGGVLRMELPLSSAEMAAALYDAAGVTRQDVAATGDMWREVAVTVACAGLGAIRDRVVELSDPGNVVAPDWLQFCRERVADAFGRPGSGMGTQ